MARPIAPLALAGLLLGAQAPLQRSIPPAAHSARPQAAAPFAARIAELSEAGGYFDTDNLISNERSYLQVVPDLRREAPAGGAYIGVGPDQNFTYIAAARPAIAFIVDVRRDNLLLHLFFKALFAVSRTRAEYAAHLFGRPLPAGPRWRHASIEEIVRYIDTSSGNTDSSTLRSRIRTVISGFGVPLSSQDLATIERFHDRFIEAGLGLQFQTTGRPPQSSYPTYRELLLARAPDGTAANYLANDEAFHIVRELQSRDLVIPVVGNLSGPSALAAIGGLLARRGERLSVLYASNVEFYLFGEGTFRDFATNLRRIPHTNRSLIIRSVFGRYAGYGGGSSSHTQPIAAMLDALHSGRIRSYRDLVGY